MAYLMNIIIHHAEHDLYNKVTIQWKFFGYSKWRPLYRFNISNPNNFQVFVDFMLKFYQLALLTWIKPRVVHN
jgi:hypothetical protein